MSSFPEEGVLDGFTDFSVLSVWGVDKLGIQIALIAVTTAFYALTFLPLHAVLGPVMKDRKVVVAPLLSLDVTDRAG